MDFGVKRRLKLLLAVIIMVRDEAQSIESTLSSFLGAGIQHFFVLDTGSTDNTISITRDFFSRNNLVGYVHQENFVDFASSRNRTLVLAETYFPHVTFFLMPDAEWYLQNVITLMNFCEQEKDKTQALYNIKIKMNTMEFYTARLFRVSQKIRFMGVVHEVPNVLPTQSVPDVVFFETKPSRFGQEKSKQRWKRDALLLKKEHHKNPKDPRTAFYLAQTYDCLGEFEKAYKVYQIRANLEGWDEENFITYYRLGNVVEKLSRQNMRYTWHQAMNYYLKAFSLRPHRIEPLVKIADYYWYNQNIQTCYLFIRYVYDIAYPQKDILFVEKEMYDFTRYEIMSRCAWYMGEYHLGQKATLMALKIYPKMEHLQKNLQLYNEKLPLVKKVI